MEDKKEKPENSNEEGEKTIKDLGDQGKYAVLNEDNQDILIGKEEGGAIDSSAGQDKSDKKEFKMVNLSYLKSNEEWDNYPVLQGILKDNLIKNYYKRPSKIQATTLKFYSENVNGSLCFVGQSHNGSGKTLSYLIPSIAHALKNKKAGSSSGDGTLSPLVIILVHTIELAKQTKDVAKKLVDASPIVCCIPGKEKKEINESSDKKKPATQNGDIIVSTPSFIEGQIKRNKMSLSRLVTLVVDEADAVLEDKDRNLKYLSYIYKKIANPNLHFLLFSATFPEKVRPILTNVGLASDVPINRVSFPEKSLTLEGVHTMIIRLEHKEKMNFIKDALLQILGGQAIVFSNSKEYCQKLLKFLVNFKLDVACIFGSPMTVGERDYVMDQFTGNKVKILITTNLLARGVDLRRVKLVINADLPVTRSEASDRFVADFKTYLHRVGRTGRFGDQGIALNVLDGPEAEKHFTAIQSHYQIKDIINLKEPRELEDCIRKLDELNIEKRKDMEENF